MTQNPESCVALGMRLGEALATVHTSEYLYKNVAWTDFINPDASALVTDEVVRKIKEILTQYLPLLRRPHELTSCEMEESISRLSEIVRGEFKSTEGAVKMFSNGDLWPGSILLNSGMEPKISIIDWKFAGASKVLWDMAKLSAWLHLFAEASWFSMTSLQPQKSSLSSPLLGSWDTLAVTLTQNDCVNHELKIIGSTWVLQEQELFSNVTSQI